jgi:hypothetical protein
MTADANELQRAGTREAAMAAVRKELAARVPRVGRWASKRNS